MEVTMTSSLRAASKRMSTLIPGNQVELSQSVANSEARQELEKALKELDSVRYEDSEPWKRTGETWSRSRMLLAKCVMSQTFESSMGVVILINLIIMVFESNADAQCYPTYQESVGDCPWSAENTLWRSIVNVALLAIYTAEITMRLYVEQTSFIWNRWNQIDGLLVVLGWTSTLASDMINLSFLRFMRIARLLRAMRLLLAIPEFYMLLTGIASSVRAILFGSVCLVSALILWAIIVVQVIHPVNASISYEGCERCSRGFASVQAAALTLFQSVVAGDSWGLISVRVIEKEPWTAFILVAIVVTISLGIMNLILAVIVERAAEAREKDVETKRKNKLKTQRIEMMKLATYCERMDEDSSGTLSLEELLEGRRNSVDIDKLFTDMDLHAEDLATMFSVLDEDRSGDVSYLEFIKSLDSAARKDPLMLSNMIKFSVAEVRILIEQEVMKVLRHHTQLLTDQTSALQLLVKQVNSGISGQESQHIMHEDRDELVAVEKCFADDCMRQLEDLDQMVQQLSDCSYEFQVMSRAEECLDALQARLDAAPDQVAQRQVSASNADTKDPAAHRQNLLRNMHQTISARLADEQLLLDRKRRILAWLSRQAKQEGLAMCESQVSRLDCRCSDGLSTETDVAVRV
eukprot:TRINITY_DN76762_c0_g1_i1.p1 TRINITY_DN76762_c0_g1~~TRINITY_DN76762_c0_g1_i1.p1  ORF type:complete len:635 (+),score=74.16 TRINITY_DN76762_c0_g1_i1:61-1965(+)